MKIVLLEYQKPGEGSVLILLSQPLCLLEGMDYLWFASYVEITGVLSLRCIM